MCQGCPARLSLRIRCSRKWRPASPKVLRETKIASWLKETNAPPVAQLCSPATTGWSPWRLLALPSPPGQAAPHRACPPLPDDLFPLPKTPSLPGSPLIPPGPTDRFKSPHLGSLSTPDSLDYSRALAWLFPHHGNLPEGRGWAPPTSVSTGPRPSRHSNVC